MPTAGAISLVGVCDLKRRVLAEECPGGAFAGAPEDACREPVKVVRLRRPQPQPAGGSS